VRLVVRYEYHEPMTVVLSTVSVWADARGATAANTATALLSNDGMALFKTEG
jgi:hypothetical protein